MREHQSPSTLVDRVSSLLIGQNQSQSPTILDCHLSDLLFPASVRLFQHLTGGNTMHKMVLSAGTVGRTTPGTQHHRGTVGRTTPGTQHHRGSVKKTTPGTQLHRGTDGMTTVLQGPNTTEVQSGGLLQWPNHRRTVGRTTPGTQHHRGTVRRTTSGTQLHRGTVGRTTSG